MVRFAQRGATEMNDAYRIQEAGRSHHRALRGGILVRVRRRTR